MRREDGNCAVSTQRRVAERGSAFSPPRALDTAAQHPGSVAGLAIKFLQDFDPFSGGEMKQIKQIRVNVSQRA